MGRQSESRWRESMVWPMRANASGMTRDAAHGGGCLHTLNMSINDMTAAAKQGAQQEGIASGREQSYGRGCRSMPQRAGGQVRAAAAIISKQSAQGRRAPAQADMFSPWSSR